MLNKACKRKYILECLRYKYQVFRFDIEENASRIIESGQLNEINSALNNINVKKKNKRYQCKKKKYKIINAKVLSIDKDA